MKASETALFADLDGTLLGPDGALAPEDRDAVAAYVRAGGMFGISTGRQQHNALLRLPGLEINAPSVVLNGAAVYDYAAEKCLFTRYLEREVSDPPLRRALAEVPGAELQVYTDAGIFYVTPEEGAEPLLLSLHLPCSFVRWDDVAADPWIKCLIYAPPEHLQELGDVLAEAGRGGCTLVPGAAGPGGCLRYYELMPAGVSKGSALEALRSNEALAGRTFFAMGDYWNDYELLRAADIAVAPANAIPEIRAIARYTTVSNANHAVAKVLSELIPSL